MEGTRPPITKVEVKNHKFARFAQTGDDIRHQVPIEDRSGYKHDTV